MIGWAIFLGYLAVSVFTGRQLLRMFMSRPVCTMHMQGWFTGRCFSHFGSDGPRRTAPLGEVEHRSLNVGLASLSLGLIWPFTLLLLAVMKAPATSGELKRRTDEMAETIARLEKQIGGER